jgi:hypothetical protein
MVVSKVTMEAAEAAMEATYDMDDWLAASKYSCVAGLK